MRLVAVIPAFNEAAAIAQVVQNTRRHVEGVVVVDDGSADATAEIARQAGAEVIVKSHNQGKGAALQTGLDYAVQHGYDVAIALDGDGQHDPASIPALVAPLLSGETDMAVGSRKAEWRQRMPLVRRLTNAFMSWLLSRVAGQYLEDTQSGYRAIGAAVIRDVRVESTHFAAESEFLLKAARAGFRISWVPIAAIYGGRPSHIHPVRDTVRFLRMMWRVLNSPRHAPPK